MCVATNGTRVSRNPTDAPLNLKTEDLKIENELQMKISKITKQTEAGEGMERWP